MFFEIRKFPHVPLWTDILYTKFQVDRTYGLLVTVFLILQRHQVAKLRNLFYLTKELSHKQVPRVW